MLQVRPHFLGFFVVFLLSFSFVLFCVFFCQLRYFVLLYIIKVYIFHCQNIIFIYVFPIFICLYDPIVSPLTNRDWSRPFKSYLKQVWSWPGLVRAHTQLHLFQKVFGRAGGRSTWGEICTQGTSWSIAFSMVLLSVTLIAKSSHKA